MQTFQLSVPSAELAVETRGRGPLLVILQAGAAGIEGSAAIAPHLERQFTVVSYARRGLVGSPIAAGARATIADHADDVARIVEKLGGEDGRAYVLGASIGGIIALELVRRHPARVARAVAFEPSLLAVLDEPLRGELRAAHAGAERVFAERGLDAAIRAAVDLGQIDPEDREPGIAPAAPTADLAKNLAFFLANDAEALRTHELDVDALAPHVDRLVIAAGASRPDRWARVIAQTLARRLGLPLAELPGGHTAYVLRPRAFAAGLVDRLRHG